MAIKPFPGACRRWLQNTSTATAPYAAWRLLRHAALPLALCWLAPWVTPTPAWGEEPREARVKAAYLYNFLLFVDWPGTAADSTMRVCTLGQGAVIDALAPIVERTAAGRAIALKRLQDTASAGSCHLLFIAESAQSRLRETLLGLRGSTTLTVSDIPEFARRGGMIGFIRRDRRIRLEINEFNARNAGPRISSKLLEVAVRVYSAPGSKP